MKLEIGENEAVENGDFCTNCHLPCTTKFHEKCLDCMVFEKRLLIRKQRKLKLRMTDQNLNVTNCMPG